MSAVMKDDQESSEREDAQRMLADAVNTFVTRATTVKRVREQRDTQPGFDRNLWQSIADQGWLGIHVPEQYGGQGLGFGEMRVVVEGLVLSVEASSQDTARRQRLLHLLVQPLLATNVKDVRKAS